MKTTTLEYILQQTAESIGKKISDEDAKTLLQKLKKDLDDQLVNSDKPKAEGEGLMSGIRK